MHLIITKGFVLDGTLNNYLTFHLRPKKSSDFNLVSTEILGEKTSGWVKK